MAGFDFTFRCKEVDTALGRALLRRVQGLARNLDLEFHYNLDSDGWYVTVDGPIACMQALIQPVAVQLMPFGEGFPSPKSVRRRRGIVQRLIDEFCDGIGRMRKMIEDVAEQLGGTPNSYFFNEGSATHLTSQVREFERSLILFHNGLVSASQFAEEAHTLTDALLKACLPSKDRDGAFADRLKQVATVASLDPKHEQVLVRLKDRRKMSKHYSQRVKHADMTGDIVDLVSALHCLFDYMRRSRASAAGTG
jgi:hypothetical protein